MFLVSDLQPESPRKRAPEDARKTSENTVLRLMWEEIILVQK
jgi:hypothetical protein